jgi:hypothetical protein
MNPWVSIVAICSITILPGILFGVYWWYVIKRGWGSRWLLAISITIFMSLIFTVISLAAQEPSILFLGLGVSILGGGLLYLYLRTSPLSDTLIGKSQSMQKTGKHK